MATAPKASVYGENYDQEEAEAAAAKASRGGDASKKRKAITDAASLKSAAYDWAELADNGKVVLPRLYIPTCKFIGRFSYELWQFICKQNSTYNLSVWYANAFRDHLFSARANKKWHAQQNSTIDVPKMKHLYVPSWHDSKELSCSSTHIGCVWLYAPHDICMDDPGWWVQPISLYHMVHFN